MPSVSAIVSTFQRPAECRRAVASALGQSPPPIEVLVCDDGSTDDTPEVMRALERRDARVRYLRVEPNRGTPAPARNLGVREARADLVAFLDDDDAWLPGKLARQLEHAGDADVIATNAVKTDGKIYFPGAPPLRRPTRREILQDNPIILSSALVSRERLLAAGGFPEPRWLGGVADYGAWLALADRCAAFVVLGDPLVQYTSHGDERFSTRSGAQMQRASARLAWQRWRRRPLEPDLLRAAMNKTAAALRR